MSQVSSSPGSSGADARRFDTDSGSAAPAAGVVEILGGIGCTTSGSGNTVTIDVETGAYTWTEVTGTSQALAVQNGYVANNAGLVTLTLPATAAIGDTIRVVGKGAGLFKIGQNAGQTIYFVATASTTGTGGSVTAVEQYATIELVCTTANSGWTAMGAQGNFTVV